MCTPATRVPQGVNINLTIALRVGVGSGGDFFGVVDIDSL